MGKSFGTYELITIEPINEFNHYYYFYTWQTVRSCKIQKPMPDKMRLLILDREETPISVRLIWPWTYIYRKYFKQNFAYGRRIKWEKEKI